MKSIFRLALLPCALLPLLPCIAKGFEARATGHAQSSISATGTILNQFKLTVDPSIPNVDQYIPISGSLDTHYDTSQFSLNIDPSTGTFGLGSSVVGEGPYQVTGFEVQTIDGGLVDVQTDPVTEASKVTEDTSAPLDPSGGAVGGGFTGNVYNIDFQIIPDRRSEAQPADVDQNFYSLLLTAIGTNPPGYDYVFTTPGNSVTLVPANAGSGLPNIVIPYDQIDPSSTPEASTGGFLAAGGLVLLGRRKFFNRFARPLAVS